MKNWKKAIALVASAAALVSVAACGSSNAGGSSDSGKKTVGFVAVGPEGGFRTANEKDIQKAFEDAGFDLTYWGWCRFVGLVVDSITTNHATRPSSRRRSMMLMPNSVLIRLSRYQTM